MSASDEAVVAADTLQPRDSAVTSASQPPAGDFAAVEGLLDEARLRTVTRLQLERCTPARFFRAFWADDATWADEEHARVHHTNVRHEKWQDHPQFQQRRLKRYDAPWSWQGVSGTSQVTEEEVAFFTPCKSRLTIVSTLTMVSDVQPYCNSYVTHTLITVAQLEGEAVDIEIVVGTTFKKDVGWKVLEDFIRKIVHDIGVDHWKRGRSLMDAHYSMVWKSWEVQGLLQTEELALVPLPDQDTTRSSACSLGVDDQGHGSPWLFSTTAVMLVTFATTVWSATIAFRLGLVLSFQLASLL